MKIFLGCQFFLWFPFYLSILGLEVMTTYHIVNSFSVVWLLVSSAFAIFLSFFALWRIAEGTLPISPTGKSQVKQESISGGGEKIGRCHSNDRIGNG
jgi:hypothetical protein